MPEFRSARAIVSLASGAVALLSIAYGDFAPGGAMLPDWTPYRGVVTTFLAVSLLAASAGLHWRRTGIPSSFVIGGYYTIWLLISVPIALSHPLTIGAWYPICEALTALVAPCVISSLFWSTSNAPLLSLVTQRTVRTAQIAFGLTCIFYGSSHFAYADYTASMIPVWIPGALGLAYVTGLAHIAAGLGIAFCVLPRLAAVLETTMMSTFGILVWFPTFFMQSPPKWATPAHNQWSEVVANLVLVASAWTVATSLNHMFRQRLTRASTS